MQNWPLPGCVVWADLSVRGLDPTRFKLCGRAPGRSGRCGRRGSEAAAGAQSPDHRQAAAAPQQKWPRPARCTKDASTKDASAGATADTVIAFRCQPEVVSR